MQRKVLAKIIFLFVVSVVFLREYAKATALAKQLCGA